MSTCVEFGHVQEMGDAENRDCVYSPASSYSTYSHEVKYIFEPVVEDNPDEYSDYSHIAPRSKQQNYLSHTPRTLSASSQVSGKENLTPQRDEAVLEASQQAMVSRTNSVMSSASRDRGPISPRMEEALYSTTYGYGQRKPVIPQEHVTRDRTYFSPNSEVPPYPYAKHSYPVWKNNNSINNNHPSQHPQGTMFKNSNFHPDYNRQNRSNSVNQGGQPNTFQNFHPLNNINNNSYHHYQQPQVQGNEPPYPPPPRYNHQHHMRRKTWSPPALKMSLLNAGSQGSRVCYSNDSLDFAEEAGIEPGIERKTQSLSEDLDVTPPRLAPISGVLAQKPGPNLIKPIAFKPVQAGTARSPVNPLNRRTSSGDDHIHAPQETARPHAMKLGISMLGVRGSPDSQNSKSNPGAFNSMAKSHHHNFSSQQLAHSYPEHPQHPSSHPSSGNSSHNNSQHNSSSSSHHMSSSSYINVAPNSQHNLSGISSHVSSTADNNEFLRASDRPDSVPSMNTSRVSSHTVDGVLQTPSPSDSGVGELEAILREKDAEINTLREVMDRNERAIFQVYEERRHVWLQDTQELRDDYERKLKVLSRKSYKTEQVLSLQVYKLQQEQKTLQEEKAKVTIERDQLKQQLEENQSEITELRSRLDSLCTGSGNGGQIKSSDPENQALMEELALKNKELITLKLQLQTFETDMDRKNKEVSEKVREIAGKTEQMKSLKEELLRIKHPPTVTDASSQTHVPSEVAVSENMKPSMLGERDRTINSLQDELLDIKAQLAALKDEHEKEREQWLDEKNKVVRYQKQLQLNYVQMQRKNATLETEVQQLTLELENRDMKLIALDEESMC